MAIDFQEAIVNWQGIPLVLMAGFRCMLNKNIKDMLKAIQKARTACSWSLYRTITELGKLRGKLSPLELAEKGG